MGLGGHTIIGLRSGFVHEAQTRARNVSTSTVAALLSKMALTGQRIAMVDMVLLVFPAFSYRARVCPGAFSKAHS